MKLGGDVKLEISNLNDVTISSPSGSTTPVGAAIAAVAASNQQHVENVKLIVNSVNLLISLKYANGLRNGANSDTHRCKQLTEHGEERCIKLREVAGFSAVRTIFQIVGPRKILHCLLGK